MKSTRVAAMLLLLLPVAAEARWIRGETPSFIGYSRGSADDLRAQLRELQDFDALTRMLTGNQEKALPTKLPVYFVSGRDLNRDGKPNTVAGFYTAGPGLVAAYVATDRAGGFGQATTVLFHEYVHHFMYQHSRASYPAWYTEGFAEYLSTANFTKDSIRFGNVDPGRAYMLASSTWLPPKRLLTARVSDLRTTEIGSFYAQSWLAVHYLMRDQTRNQGLQRYLRAINAGEPSEPAWRTAMGVDYEGFGKDLRRYLDRGRLTMSVLSGPGASKRTADSDITITSLPLSLDDLLLPAARLARRPLVATRAQPDDAALLADVRRAAAKMPGDAAAQAVLAEAELKLGVRATGVRLLDEGLAKTPNDPQLAYLRGLALLTEADGAADPADTRRRARVLLTRANGARPDDYRILAAHAASFDGLALPDKELPVLMRAVELAPQVAEVAGFAGLVLARRGDKAGARALLLPFANDPHGGAQAAAFAALIAAIERGEHPQLLPQAD